MVSNPNVLAGLNPLGFHLVGDAFLPIQFDRDAWANGFADEDLTDAMIPLSEALRRVMDAKRPMEALSDAIGSAMMPAPR